MIASPKSYYVKAITDTGIKRRNSPNQDSVGTVLPSLFQRRPPFLALADGMGGYAGGRIASQIAIRVFTHRYLHSDLGKSALPFFENAVIAAHREMIGKANKNPDLAAMGSTVVAIVLYPDHVDLVNVGDSRAYIVHEDQLIQISKDQSRVAEKVREGIIAAEDAQHDPDRNQLTMSLSAKRATIEPFFYSAKLEHGDGVLLCSDGLWGMVSEPLIQSIAANFPPQQAATKLIQLANEAGGRDNISVIIAMPKEKIKQLKLAKLL